MDMAARIKERRLAMDYTQEELASKLDMLCSDKYVKQ